MIEQYREAIVSSLIILIGIIAIIGLLFDSAKRRKENEELHDRLNTHNECFRALHGCIDGIIGCTKNLTDCVENIEAKINQQPAIPAVSNAKVSRDERGKFVKR